MIDAPSRPTPPGVFLASVLSTEPAGGDAWILSLRPEEGSDRARVAQVQPSQFFMFSDPARCDPLVPRPFSIYRTRGEELHFLIKVFGNATRLFTALAPGAKLRLTGPLGRPWPSPQAGERLVMIAGGVGLAPFPLQIEKGLAAGLPRSAMRLLLGAQNAAGLYDLDYLRGLPVELELATEDGSVGLEGRTTDLLSEGLASGRIREDDRFLVCGPDPMMAAVKRVLAPLQARVWFSLETYMACGLGVCNGCIVPVRPEENAGWPYARACSHGPVFSIEELQEDALERCHG